MNRPSFEVFNDLRAFGCSDGNCEIARPHGMHTNGGCTCVKDIIRDANRVTMKKIMRLHQEHAASLRAEKQAVVENYKPGWIQGLTATALQNGWTKDMEASGCDAVTYIEERVVECMDLRKWIAILGALARSHRMQ